MNKLIIDLDYLKYSAAAVGEKRTIIVKHAASGREREFANRTEFWGRGKKVGGWLGELNTERINKSLTPFTAEEFTIEDVQTPEPIENVLHTVKLQMEGIFTTLGTKKYKGFLGKGESFRVERSTIIKYKDNRKDMLRPIHLDAVQEYLLKKYKAEEVTGIEADDRCVMECYKKPNNILIGLDKDYLGTSVNYYRVNEPERGIINCDKFGSLWRKENGDVTGEGRMFFYFQVASSDDSDNYAANSACKTPWGDVSAFKALQHCQNDREALETVVGVYKKLYPEPTKIIGWRGNEIEVGWLYCMTENFDLARMLRVEKDEVCLKDVLVSMGIA